MNYKKITVFLVCFSVLFISGIVVVSATTTGSLAPSKIGIEIGNPFRHGDTITEFLKAVIDNIILPIGAIIAVLAFIYSGFLYVTAQGKPADITKAHNAFLYTAVGTLILLGAWVILSVLDNTVKQLLS